MFNLSPGQGLGFSASKEIAFGLGTSYAIIEIITEIIKTFITKDRILQFITKNPGD